MQEQPVLLEEDGFEDEILVEEETTVVNAMWGDIGGNIENQTDLQNALDAKQDSLTETQLSAVNSGITAEKVTAYDGYADQIASKADQSALNAEATTREQADTALGRRIDDEALARQQADNGLQSQIDAITSKSDVVDVVANYAALQAYDTSALSDNDVIKVLDDETHEDALTYYRWSTATQTWSYIGQEAPYYSKGQMDVKLAEKQDKLTAGANIQIENGTISSTDTTYTAGNGLNLNGTEFSADTDVLATKSDLEGYYTKPETDNLLAPKLEAEVVAELPTTGAEGKLYLTPKAHTTQTATGNPITATVAEGAGAIESFQLDGDTYQQSYTGKNLCNPATFVKGRLDNGVLGYASNTTSLTVEGNSITYTTNASYRGIVSAYIPVEPNTKYTLSRTVTSEITVSALIDAFESDSEAGWIERLLTATFTTPNNCHYVRISFQNYASGTATISNTMVEKSATATSYEPYVGGVPSPNPDYPQPIQTVTGEQTVEIVGKNLAQPLERYTYNRNGSATIESQSNDTVVFSTSTSSVSSGVYIYKTNGNNATLCPELFTAGYVVSFDVVATDTCTFEFGVTGNHTTTTVSTTKQRVSVATATGSGMVFYNNSQNGATVTISNIQVEAGSTASSFAPYSKQTLPLDLGDIQLCGLGDDGNGNPLYKDYIYPDGEDWKLHKDVGKYTFADVSGFIWGSDRNRLYISQDALAELGIAFVPPASQEDIFYALSNKFKAEIFSTGYATSYTGACLICSSGRTWSFRGGWSDQDAARNALAGTTVYYALATPTDTIITDTNLIAQLEAIRTASLENGANTITNTATGSNLAGDMEIGYYGFASRNRYDKWLWLDINNEYEQIGS